MAGQWRYKSETCGPNDIETKCNDLGRDGWEAVGLAQVISSRVQAWIVLFKRRAE